MSAAAGSPQFTPQTQSFFKAPQVFKDKGCPDYIFLRSQAPAWLAESLFHATPSNPTPPPQTLSSGGVAKNLTDHHVNPDQVVYHNPPPSVLYECAIGHEAGSYISATGALTTTSHSKTGRSPKDKRVVLEDCSKDDVWWGPVNIPIEPEGFLANRERAMDYLDLAPRLYVIDAFAGWDPKHQLKIRIVCTRAYHALFMHNMLIRPTREQLKSYGHPDFTVYNAGCFPSNRFVKGVSSETSVALSLQRMEMVILGTQYAGEMKKGVLTLMMYLGPKKGTLTLHSSATEDPKTGRSTLFFGLSGTGKTTLSADPRRLLIGDDEHVWHDDGVYNIEGGCYAKCIKLSKENEPEIYDAIKFGAIVENVVMDSDRAIDYDDVSLTENTRCAYPLDFIPNAKIPAVTGHPTNIVLLTCDASGVLPPVSRLTNEQVMYQFISGYTAKMPGVEAGNNEVTPTFSPCFGGPFLVWHPAVYAKLLVAKMNSHKADAWLVNTGWVRGPYGVGSRCPIKVTRAIVDAINEGTLAKQEFTTMEGFGFQVPKTIPGVSDTSILNPIDVWPDKAQYIAARNKLAGMFVDNMKKYEAQCSSDILSASPQQS
eukprot:TRINITY_DN46141_c0_g1_i1.p1 TRINITY_DN46141_c0_g1~~TRINITY_DN46141_c0_g1_i1.p1  ORF type:complete len:596 (+),score=138.12 TRINITY_DN46141_c0_g1_i1:78-1865(+)